MPPKKGKQDVKKAVEEKTFGMKNKKGAKGQQKVQQVQQSMNATAARAAGRGPSKKELKEMQKAQEDEMLALFNAVPKKDDGKDQQVEQDMDPDQGPTFTDITQEIEYQRANVVAKTKITDEVFQAWRKKKLASRRGKEEEEKRERLKKGLLTGREIFLESKTAIQDDDTAAGDDDMLREVDEELEIAKMNAQAAEEQRRAREEAGLDPDGDEDPSATAGPSTSAAAGASTSAAGPSKLVTKTGVELSAADAALLDESSDDDVDLDALEAQLHASSLNS